MSPNEDTALMVVEAMTNEKVVSLSRLITGEQNFVFAAKTKAAEYVIRMANVGYKKAFVSAIYWQEKLIPLGIPLAKFIKTDLEGNYSDFPALLMHHLPGDDLCNVYSQLTDTDKKNLANEIVKIQAMTDALPDGLGYGIMSSYEAPPEAKSWYDFLVDRLMLFRDIIKKKAVFDANEITKVLSIAENLKDDLSKVRPRPFLWDASERNVIVHQGKISGIVDVDELCFGDPLFVLGLTYAALEVEGHDTVYPDYWAQFLKLDKMAERRLYFYRLFYTIVFMRKHSMTSNNRQVVNFDIKKLQNMFEAAVERIKLLD